MRRGHPPASAALVAALLFAGALPLVVVPAAVADDKKKNDKQQQKDAAQAKKEKTLVEIATSFEKKDVSGLLARVPKDQKLSLTLDGKDGDYSINQAKGVLEAWFKNVELSVTTKDTDKAKVKFEGDVGYFPMTIKKTGADKAKDGTLGVTIGDAAADGSHPLKKLSVVEK